MLRVVDLGTGAALSCSLTRDSTVSQVVIALKKRQAAQLSDESPFCELYGLWCDSKQRIHAKKLRGEDRPLVLIEHLKRTTGAAPKLHFSKDLITARLILANVIPEQEGVAFAQRGIILDGPHESEFFATLQRLNMTDLCGLLLTNATNVVTKRVESGLRWWVLSSERLWFQQSPEDDTKFAVNLADNKVLGPWGAEFELQTTLNVYRLIAPNAKDASLWVEHLTSRIVVATENELLACADVLIADEEKALWKLIEGKLAQLDTIEGWCASSVTSAQLCRFARVDGNEYLLLFYLDNTQGASINPLSTVRRFISLASLPPSLTPLKQNLITMIDKNADSVTLLTVRHLLDTVKHELETGLLNRLKARPDILCKLVSELPLLLEQELR